MEINNIVIVSPKYKAIKEMIEKKQIQKNIRYYEGTELSQQDLQWADALVTFTKINPSFDFSQLKWVHSLGAGVDHFLYKRKWNENVLLTRTICSSGQKIAEFCLGYILRDIQLQDHFLALKKKKCWEPATPSMLSEQNVLIYGTGEIGQKTAEVFSTFGTNVYGVSQSGRKKSFFHDVMTFEDHFPFLHKVDYIINTLPLTEKTEGIFTSDIFDKAKGIGFINVGRGASLDEDALIQAVDDGNVRFAVLDVFKDEPLPDTNALWNHPNIYITPHISAITGIEEGVQCFIDTLKNLEENKPLSNKADIQKGY